MKRMDLNCDMGEIAEAVDGEVQEALMRHVTSVNVACGGHAGDARMMRATIEQALRAGAAIGAHPGYEDRKNFGRNELALSAEEIAASVARQVAALEAVARECGAKVGHVKAHGALYNQAARDEKVAAAVAEGVRRWRSDVLLLGLAGSQMLQVFREAGFRVAAEAFADRRYEADGNLRSRKFGDALLGAEEAAAQALRIVEEGRVIAVGGTAVPLQAETICIHGDSPGAVDIAAAVRYALEGAGVKVCAAEKTP